MAYFNEFPGTRSYDGDLRFILEKLKEIQEKIEELEAEIENLKS